MKSAKFFVSVKVNLESEIYIDRARSKSKYSLYTIHLCKWFPDCTFPETLEKR